MSSHARASCRALFIAAALSLGACGSSAEITAVGPTPTPGVDEPQTPVMRCAPPLPGAAAQLAQTDCQQPERTS